MTKQKKILFGLTGSIACYKACTVISALIKANYEVQVVATDSALKFVGEATLEGLTGKPVISNSFLRGHMMDHIRLAREADLFVIAPLTSHHIGALAHGLADDFISTLVLAYEPHKPIIVAPAMNVVMWQAPIVQQNIAALRQRNFKILWPNEGVLACGEEGVGKMQEPEQILAAINASLTEAPTATSPSPELSRPTQANTKVLVTFGGTRELIDGVRSLANTSTGHTGALICDALVAKGFDVVGLHSQDAELPKTAGAASRLQLLPFTTAQDLDQTLRETLVAHKFNAVIHLAAISDFAVDHLETKGEKYQPSENLKLSSTEPLTIVLKPAKKILHSIKEYAHNPMLPVIAFKLTKSKDQEANLQAAQKLFLKNQASTPMVDFVVHNDETEIDRTRGEHPFRLLSADGRGESLSSTTDLALKLTEIIRDLPKLSNSTDLNKGPL